MTITSSTVSTMQSRGFDGHSNYHTVDPALQRISEQSEWSRRRVDRSDVVKERHSTAADRSRSIERGTVK